MFLNIRAWYCIVLLIPSILCAEEIKPFTTDGCSAFPGGTVEQQSLWTHCCIRHDLAYWKGGSYQERLEADEVLSTCVSKVGEPEIAEIMLAGVRVGGSAYLPTPFRWGYGWSFPKKYRRLNDSEKREVQKKLKQFEAMIRSIFEGIKTEG